MPRILRCGILTKNRIAAARELMIVAACVTVFASHVVAKAQQGATREAALILRVLSYDRNLPARARGRVNVLIVYRRGDSSSERVRTELKNAVNQLGRRMTVANMVASAEDHAFTDATALVTAARSRNTVAIYVCPGLEREHTALGQASQQARSLAITASEQLVRNGLGVGIVKRGSDLRLVVNLRGVQSAGARLDPALLRLAEVIR